MNLGIAYRGMLGGGTVIEPRIDFSYQDRTCFDANNTVEIAQLDAVTVANLSLAVEPANAPFVRQPPQTS